MALLRLEASDDDEDRIARAEAEALPHAGGCPVVRVEAAEIAAVVDHDDLVPRQPLFFDEVPAVGVGHRDVLVHEAAGDAVDDVAGLEPPAPGLAQVRRLDDQRDAGQRGDRRREEARIEEVRVHDVRAPRAHDREERAGRADLVGLAQAERGQRHVARHVAPDLLGHLGRADQRGPEPVPVEPAEQREDMLFRPAAGQRVREVEDGDHRRGASAMSGSRPAACAMHAYASAIVRIGRGGAWLLRKIASDDGSSGW